MEVAYGLYTALQAPLFFGFLGVFLTAYFILAGGSYAYLYLLKSHPLSHKKIQLAKPSRKEVLHELFWSVLALAVWSVMAVVLVFLVKNGFTFLYFDISQHGLVYFCLSVIVLLVTHDAYFYWTHRLMHSRSSFFTRMHDVHHASQNPTPFAIYSFGPFEAVLLGLYVYLIVFIMPVHIFALLVLFIFDTVINTAGHLGYEFFPSGIHGRVLGKVFNTSTHHNLHHQHGRSNFASYFTFWDSCMKTNDREYKETWERLHSR